MPVYDRLRENVDHFPDPSDNRSAEANPPKSIHVHSPAMTTATSFTTEGISDSLSANLQTGPGRPVDRPASRLRLARLPPWLCLLALLPAIIQAQPRPDYAARVAELQGVMDSYYRGETIKNEQARVNRLTDSFNREVEHRNSTLAEAHAAFDKRAALLAELEGRIGAADKSLQPRPDASDADAVNAYNTRVQDRNALVERYHQQAQQLKADMEARKAVEDRIDAELATRQAEVDSARRHCAERSERLKAFTESDEPMRFFVRLNRLLADVKAAARAGHAHPALLEQVRSLRRELAAWAMREEEADPNGHVVVPATIGDETCWFIVDTGAHDTTLSLEIVDALGLSAGLGADVKIVVVGGSKINGRSFEIPRLSVAGVNETGVSAAAVAPSSVGLDGLLGQTFLKRFVYTIDERRPEKLLLTRR
jgi:clan AA aspartic protease (TIGR02281 family)